MAPSAINRRGRRVAITVGLVTFALTASAHSAAAADVETFRPTRQTQRALYFNIGRLEPSVVGAGKATMRLHRSSDRIRRVRRHITATRLRSVVARGGRFRLRASGRTSGARLRVSRRNSLQTTITSGPSGEITAADAAFAFSASVSEATFECRLDAAVWSSCGSPHGYSNLAAGAHVFEVRAKYDDTRDATPAARRFTVAGPTTQPSPPPPGCAVDPATLTAAGCQLVRSDTSAQSDLVPLWRRLDCADASRYRYLTSDGDTAPTALGQSQGNAAFRQLTVMDGDDVYGERCEIGKNNLSDTFQLYGEGQRRITFISFRLPSDFPLELDSWHQEVLQMKQTQPSNNGGGTPVLALHAIDGHWQLKQSDSPGPASRASTIWSTPARKNVWTRAAFDITYSQDPGVGRIKLYIDTNGDGDALDAGEQSPAMSTYTLKHETSGSNTSIPVGGSIPSHLRVGPYRQAALECPATGCAVHVDNVGVVRP